MYKGRPIGKLSVETVLRDGNCLFRRFWPFVALETIQNNVWLHTNSREDWANACQITQFRGKIFMTFSDSTNILQACWGLLGSYIYKVRQVNFRNGPVKAKFAYLCISGCSRWHDGATARNSLENRFPEHLAVTLSRCVGCQDCQQIFVPSGHFLILERVKNLSDLSQMNMVDGPFL
jgi:hypothetical protein